VARIKNLTANNYYAAHGRTPMEILTGDTPDISEYMSFQWYQLVWYLNGDSFPNDKKKLGHWLGVSHRVGQAMCFWILTENVTIISRTSVQAVTRDELNSTVICDKLYDLDQRIESKIGNSVPNISLPLPANKRYTFDQDDEECNEAYQKELEKEEDDNISNTNYDKLLSAQVSLPSDDHHIKLGKVTGYKHDHMGNLVG
jgi:hypothetical protein